MSEKRIQFKWMALTFSFLLLSVSGCTTWHYNPTETAYPIKEGMVQDFIGKGAITIENMQPHGIEFVFFCEGGATWKGDLAKWTDTMINYLTLELTKRNLIVSGTAQKKMKVSITNAKAEKMFGGFRCKLDLRVETDDGYVKQFETTARGFTIQRSVDGTVMIAAVTILNDPDVVDYLEK